MSATDWPHTLEWTQTYSSDEANDVHSPAVADAVHRLEQRMRSAHFIDMVDTPAISPLASQSLLGLDPAGL